MSPLEAFRLLLMLGAFAGTFYLARAKGALIGKLIQDFADSFRGGPPPPSHRLPAKDPAICRRKSV